MLNDACGLIECRAPDRYPDRGTCCQTFFNPVRYDGRNSGENRPDGPTPIDPGEISDVHGGRNQILESDVHRWCMV